MSDEDAMRARRAAEIADDTTKASEDAAPTRPKRFLTPDWEDWDDPSSGDSPDENADDVTAVRGGRFAAATDEGTPQGSPTPVAARGRFSLEEAVVPAWPDRTTTPAKADPPAWPTPVTDETLRPAPSGGRARHGWSDESTDSSESTLEQPVVEPGHAAPEAVDEAAAAADAGSWHAIPVEPVPGASRAAQGATLSEKRRREPPALPTTPQPLSPAERRDALAARGRAGRSVAPGSLPEDDWTGAPLPASAVPPPSVGQEPTPIAVQEGDAPVAHRAYTRPEPEGDDEDTLWLSRKPVSRAAEPPPAGGPEPSGIATPVSARPSGSELTSPAPAAPDASTPTTPVTATPAPVVAPPSFIPPVEPPAADALKTSATSAWPVPASLPPEVPAEVADTGTTSEETDPASGTRSGDKPLWRRRPFQIGAAALILVVVLIAGFLVWANRERPSSAASSQTAAALVEHLVTANDLSSMGPGQWTEQKTESTVTQDSSAPLCFVTSADLPTPTAQAQRKLSATGASLLHRITTYATAAEATQVYEQRLTQLGQCSNIPVYLSNGATVSSLGDDAVGVTAVIQDPTAQYHTVLLVRTGSMLLTYDVAQAGAAIAYDKVLAVAAATVRAVCSSAGGGCSASPTATTGIPPTSAVPGWLTVSDLPRITTGQGRWNATSPKTTVTSAGSACENLTLATVAGPNQRRQRTYLLTEDTKVPKDFGLDEIVLDFDTPDAATAFATQLKDSITSCPARTVTAKLGNTGDITASGASGKAVTGFWRTVTQSTNPTTTFTFRVGVATVGTRVVYLLATPSPTFDFTDADWAAITSRAGQRATQS